MGRGNFWGNLHRQYDSMLSKMDDKYKPMFMRICDKTVFATPAKAWVRASEVYEKKGYETDKRILLQMADTGLVFIYRVCRICGEFAPCEHNPKQRWFIVTPCFGMKRTCQTAWGKNIQRNLDELRAIRSKDIQPTQQEQPKPMELPELIEEIMEAIPKDKLLLILYDYTRNAFTPKSNRKQ